MSFLFIFLDHRYSSKVLKVIFKCFPLILLIIAVGNSWSSSFARGSNGNLARLFWGLLFSVLGDAYLVFPGGFIFGVASFAVAQAIYTAMFGGGLLPFQSTTKTDFVIIFLVILISCTVYASVVSHMEPILVVVAALYTLLISAMLWSALMQASQHPTKSTISGAVGASLFYSSDTILSLNKWRMKIPCAQVFIMSTYYCAQLFIAGSVLW